MLGAKCRRLLILVISAFAVLVPSGVAVAACPVRPLPPLGPPAFTGIA